MIFFGGFALGRPRLSATSDRYFFHRGPAAETSTKPTLASIPSSKLRKEIKTKHVRQCGTRRPTTAGQERRAIKSLVLVGRFFTALIRQLLSRRNALYEFSRSWGKDATCLPRQNLRRRSLQPRQTLKAALASDSRQRSLASWLAALQDRRLKKPWDRAYNPLSSEPGVTEGGQWGGQSIFKEFIFNNCYIL